MDSVMLGSLTQYRRLVNEHIVQPRRAAQPASMWAGREEEKAKLPVLGHGVAGVMAGWTVSFIAAPVEHIKARLQVQYSRSRNERLYTGPIDCTRKIFKQHRIAGLWHGLGSTLLFRTGTKFREDIFLCSQLANMFYSMSHLHPTNRARYTLSSFLPDGEQFPHDSCYS